MGSDQQVYPKPVSREQTEIILNQMARGICKVYSDKEIASGFFCLIPFDKKYMEVFITIIYNKNVHLIKDIFK